MRGKREIKKLLITGGAGFIGSNFIRYWLKRHGDCEVINVDALTYAGNLRNLDNLPNANLHTFKKLDITNAKGLEQIFKSGIDAVVHFAAETHVDRSILGPQQFIKTNVIGTQILLDLALKYKVGLFLHVSTDEVYGSVARGFSKESAPHKPSSPYSASKSAADLLVQAYVKTFALPAIITRASNNYGPYQFPEKFIPLFITNALEDKPLPLYGDGKNVRDWIFVLDHCAAFETILLKADAPHIYNIGAGELKKNIEVAKTICKLLNKPTSLIKLVPDRPGHDRRYALDFSRIKNELGWSPKVKFEDGIKRSIKWYIENKKWWEEIKSGEYKNYYKKWYKEKLGAGI